MMRVLVWNMAGAFGYSQENHERAWQFVRDYDPDVAILQEAVLPSWTHEQWPSVVHSRHCALKSPGGVPWGSAIAAKVPEVTPFVADETTPWLKALWGAVVVARLPPPDRRWLASIHSNAYQLKPDVLSSISIEGLARCDEKKVWEIEVMAWELARVFEGERFVMGGDLNSSLLFDANYKRQSNHRLFDNLRRAGFQDLRLRSHHEEQRTFFREGQGHYQLDHVFGDPETAKQVAAWEVLSDAAEVQGLSDHAPIALSILPPRSGNATREIREPTIETS